MLNIMKALVVVALLGWAVPASAQAVKLEFRNGLVNLSTQNAPLRTILAEWSRLGGTRIVNGERVPGAPLTLELNGVTERQAVDVLLRTAAGYIVAPRAADSSAASSFASILILPTSAAARPATTVVQTRGRQTPRELEPDPEEDPVTDTPPDADDRDDDLVRQRAEEAARRRATANRPQIFIGDQVVEQPADGRPTQGAQPAAGSNPFGVPAGAVRPGVITAPPPQQPNNRENREP